MIENLNNTLDFIVRLSHSTFGYLLKIDDFGNEVLTKSGELNQNLDGLNKYIYILQKKGNIEEKNGDGAISFDEFLESQNFNSFYIQKLFENDTNSSEIHLVLISNKKDVYNSSNFGTIITLIDSLKIQLQDYDNIILPNNGYNRNSISENEGKLNSYKYDNSLLKSFDILELSEDLIFSLDVEGRISAVNKTGAFELDYSLEELIGRHFLDLISFDERPKLLKSFQQLISDKKLVKVNSYLKNKFGRELWYEIKLKPIRSDDRLNGIIGIGINKSKNKYLEEELINLKNKLNEANRLLNVERARTKPSSLVLEELNFLKREFLSNISHDFRTPLASIIGFSETIDSDPEIPPDLRIEFNRTILEEGKRLARLINDVLELYLIESNKYQLNKTRFNFIDLLKELVSLNKKSIENKKIEFNYEISDQEILVDADRNRILQSFNSILGYSIKTTKEKGRISLISRSMFKEFEVIITDTGKGIPKDELPGIFQKNYSHEDKNSELNSYEIGLVFAKNIIDLHKGLISVQSELNKGTSFLIKLPKIVFVK